MNLPLKIKLADNTPVPDKVKARTDPKYRNKETLNAYFKSHPNELKKFTDPLINMDLDCDAATLKEVSKLTRGFSGREIAKLFIGLQTHICAHLKGIVVRS